jgi:phosphoglycerate dehydrogenase-like enzyme
MAETTLLITVDFPEKVLERIRAVSPDLKVVVQPTRDADEIEEDLLSEIEILYTTSAVPEPEEVPNLRWLQFHLAGIDHATEKSLVRSEIAVTTLSGAAAPQMAEFALMSILSLGHHLPEKMQAKSEKLWPEDRFKRFRPLELNGSTVGIVGYGSIGREIARLCHQFHARILAIKGNAKQLEDAGYSRDDLGDSGADLPERIYPPQAIASMAAECDFLVITVPLTPDTRGMVGEEVLEKMKPTAYLVDISRGGVVDHGALVEALNSGTLAGAALDVYPIEPLPESSPLWEMPNVILSPHVAGSSAHYHERAGDLFVQNLRRYLDKEPLLNRYDSELGY